MSSAAEPSGGKRTSTRTLIIVAVLAVAVVGYIGITRAGSGSMDYITFITQRGDLDVEVTAGGNIEAQKSQEIRSEISGREGVQILSIVEEGYLVTQEDIANKKVLVELDRASLEDQMVNQEIATQSAEAGYIERKAQYEIQLNENQSNISDAKLAVKFARMDFEKFLGAKSVNDIVTRLEMERRFSDIGKEETPKPKSETSPERQRQRRPRPEGEAQSRPQGGPGGAPGAGGGRGGFSPERLKQMIADNGGEVPSFMKDRLEQMGLSVEELMERMESGDAGGRPAPDPVEDTRPIDADTSIVLDAEYLALRDAIDFSGFADETLLEDGEAKQTLRNLDDDILVAREEARLAESQLEGKERLAKGDFITQNELELEQIRKQKAEIDREAAEMSKKLYIQYTFPKQAEQLFSDYENTLMDLKRVEKGAEARLAQEEANLKASERKYNLEQEQFDDLKDQLSKTIIFAERPGLVVYGSSSESNPFRRSNEEPIQEGTTVRERQRIITIPDMNHMGVKVNIHESAVKRVSVGQTARISVDAFPDQLMEGVITKVAVLADSANAFMNPDLKVYPTVIEIKDSPDWLRPGMSAEVSILIESLTDVVYVPIQAVTYEENRQIVYVMQGGSPVKRAVKLGSFTEEFIEIKSGLDGGEEILLLAPQSTGQDETSEESATEDEAA